MNQGHPPPSFGRAVPIHKRQSMPLGISYVAQHMCRAIEMPVLAV